MRHTRKEKKKYRPDWDMTLTARSTTAPGGVEPNKAPYAQLSDPELGSVTMAVASNKTGTSGSGSQDHERTAP